MTTKMRLGHTGIVSAATKPAAKPATMPATMPAATAAALAFTLLLAGCGAGMVTIEVPLHGEKGDKGSFCFDYGSDFETGWFGATIFREAAEAGKDHVNMAVPAAALLWASVDSNSSGKLTFPFFLSPWDGTRIVLAIHPSMSVGYLNGRAIFADLSHTDTAKWLLAAPKAELATLRSVTLSGDPEVDVPALARLSDRPLAVVLPEHPNLMEKEDMGPILTALERAKPLALLDGPKLSSSNEWTAATLARMASISSLTHLGVSGAEIPNLDRLPHLRCLKFGFSGDADDPNNKKAKSLAPLAHLTNLEYLELEGCKGIEDFSALANLKNLKSLTLGECDGLTNLSPLASLTNLETLCLGNNQLKDLSGLDRLAGLRRLGLFPLPPEGTDLSPIHRLKKLEILLAPKDEVEKRQKDIAGIRQALPGVKVVGICMGSAWAVLVLALGAAAGLAIRRLRRPTGPLKKAVSCSTGILPVCTTAVQAVVSGCFRLSATGETPVVHTAETAVLHLQRAATGSAA